MKRILIVLLFVTLLFSVDAAFAAPKKVSLDNIIDFKPVFKQIREMSFEIIVQNVHWLLALFGVSWCVRYIESQMKTREENAKLKAEFQTRVRREIMKEEAKRYAKRLKEEAFEKGWEYDGMGGYRPRDGVRIQSKNDDLRIDQDDVEERDSNNTIRATMFNASDDKSSEILLDAEGIEEALDLEKDSFSVHAYEPKNSSAIFGDENHMFDYDPEDGVNLDNEDQNVEHFDGIMLESGTIYWEKMNKEDADLSDDERYKRIVKRISDRLVRGLDDEDDENGGY